MLKSTPDKYNFIMKYFGIVIILFAYSCASSKKAGETETAKSSNPVIAHRGAFKKNNFPQNSIAALKEAIKLGCYGSEFDVRMTADDSLIINHDPHYQAKEIETTTYAELLQWKLSNGEKLPTLREYILAGLDNNNTTKLICEIKPSGLGVERARHIASKVVALFKEVKATRHVVYISFDYEILKQIIIDNPKANTQYLNGEKSPEQLKADGIKGADYHFSVFKTHPEWIASAKQLGIALNAWTVNDKDDMDWLLANQFDFITTNEPELLFERRKQSPAQNGWALLWSDEFHRNGMPDTTKWRYDVGGHGWGNNELQYYTHADTNNAIISNGKLYITALKKDFNKNNYTSARLITKDKKLFQYGRIEISAKLPAGRGSWPAIWMLGDNISSIGWPACGEIDIMEHVGYQPDSIFGSIHTQSFNHMLGTQPTKGISIKNIYTQFHVYGIEWSPEKIDFFIDDTKYLTFIKQYNTNEGWPFDKPQYLILNIAVGGNWGGKYGVDNAIFPNAMQVDYVRYFKK
jgi:beta-glucanase (GH16 family)/glycerophosphoryl diester phosphodiesterase